VDTLLNVGLSNAVAASALAVVAAVVGYFCRRPAVRHALWLLVLLKLVTPPVYVAVPRPADPTATPVALALPADEALAPAPDADLLAAGDAVEVVVEEDVVGLREDLAVTLQAEPREEPAGTPPAGGAAFPWQPLVLAAWLGGSAVWLALAALRARRFARLLRYGRPAPAALQREAAGLAARLGMARAPAVRLLPGRVSPMLWAARLLLLPAGLLDRLDAAGRRTLLAHELAHLRRRDHWVRLFELLVTALFWWHPVVWWARRELREAEEQCCDAWVLWALPASAKTYALALVETVDFLSEARPALPALASGMGHVHDLRRRVTMIMQGTTPRALTWSGLIGLFGLGAFLLPVMPTWAQEETARPLRVVAVDEEEGQPLRIVALGDKADDPKEGQADVQKLKVILEKKRAELAALEAQLKAAQARAAKEGPAAGEKGKVERIVIEIVDGDKKQTFTLPAGSRVLKAEVDTLVEKIKKDVANKAGPALAEELKMRALNAAKEKAEGKKEGHRLIIEIVSDGKRQVIELPPGSRVISEGDVKAAVKRGQRVQVIEDIDLKMVPTKPGEKVPAQLHLNLKKGEGDAAEKRIQDLEKRLEELMRAVKELHGEMQKTKPPVPQRRSPKQDEESTQAQPKTTNNFQLVAPKQAPPDTSKR
jgi:beta-lactamase regulating signal transducer with metallopeptidase domain